MHPFTLLPWPTLLFPSGLFFLLHPSKLSLSLSHTLFSLSSSLPSITLYLKNHLSMAEKFSEFYEKWIRKLEEILYQLLEVSKKISNSKEKNDDVEQEVQALVSKVTGHIKEFYSMKWGVAQEDDVLVFFSPPWLSPLENAYLWVTGWKPSAVFKLLESLKMISSFEMTEEQVAKVEMLRARIKMEEEKVESEMERQQVALADRKMVELAKVCSRARTGGGGGEKVDAVVEVAVKGLLAGLEKIMKAADCVRLKTLKGILDLLTPMQSLHFLAANIAMQLRLRQWGKKTNMSASIINNK